MGCGGTNSDNLKHAIILLQIASSGAVHGPCKGQNVARYAMATVKSNIIILTGEMRSFLPTNALAQSLSELLGSKKIEKIQCTRAEGRPAFIADVLLKIRGLLPGDSSSNPYHVLVCPYIPTYPRSGLPLLSDLLASLLVKRQDILVCIVDPNTLMSTGNNLVYKLSLVTTIVDLLGVSQLQFRPHLLKFPSASPPIPTDIDRLRNIIKHWVGLGGLNLAGLLDQTFYSLSTAFKSWDYKWYTRYSWRSFYAVCQWFAMLPEPLAQRNAVSPQAEHWLDWILFLNLLYDNHLDKAEDLFPAKKESLKKCITWIQ